MRIADHVHLGTADVLAMHYSAGRTGANRGAGYGFLPAVQHGDRTGGRDWRCFDALAELYFRLGRQVDAVAAAKRAVELAAGEKDARLWDGLRAKLARYLGR